MPLPVALNIAIRNTVRRSMVLPRPLLPVPPLIFEPDTSPDSAAKLQKAGVLTSPAQAAQAAAQAQEAARRAQLRPPAAGRMIAAFASTPVAGSAWLAEVFGPFSFPYTLEELFITVANANAAGTVTVIRYTVLISTNDSIALAQLQGDTNIILDDPDPQEGIKQAVLSSSGQNTTVAMHRPAFRVESYPTFIKFLHITNVGLQITSFAATINEEIPLLIPGIAFQPPQGRININLNTAPTPARSTRPPIPRSATISTTQGGALLFQRTIAWDALDPAIQRDYFNTAIGQPPEFKNVQWNM